MTSDPERLLGASSGCSLAERELLESVHHVGPPSTAKDEAWRGLAAKIAVASAAGTAHTSTAAAATKVSVAQGGLYTQVAALVLGGGLMVGGGWLALRAPEASTPLVAPPAVVAPKAVAPPPRAHDEAPVLPPPVIEERRSEKVAGRRTEPPRVDSLKAESGLLSQARAELRSGNSAGAQASLDKLQAQFPKGVLLQEREVLAIEVLHARGNVEAARRRAKAFIAAYPKSPHSQTLVRFVN
jgi:hypothetical protein